jgi:hypothetical protein
MANMLGEDDVDIAGFVNEGYKPVYCKNKISKLINPQPNFDFKKDSSSLIFALKKWSTSCGFRSIDLAADTSALIEYKYSYLITYHPVDVYTVKIRMLPDDSVTIIFFRKDGGSNIEPLNTEG